ncbi:sensor histidine kinase [Mycobacterium montefiorense]|uniref:sensor histidine kinase n=2 Tax=Mycobacterium montefiorense TaxID=154654 RepID=UPI0021F29861|nr:histidine kinase [Mycobacterium montefiorense]MCV7425312.1 hypothetical protein [Mycobacterium montefiorense]
MAALEHIADRRRLLESAALTQAVVEERAAIARDLHDVISHHVSATGMQAGAARRALGSGNTARASTSLEAIERSSRAAASDLHRQLDLLHGKDIDGHRQPSIANLDQVLETVRGAGLEVKADIDTVPPSLEQSLDIVVYRIAQELLTNALKYGEGCALLTIKMTDTQIDIVQKNSMPSTMAEDRVSAGRGLAGINQRVSIFGGVFEFGSDRSTSTWWATATIPLGEW